MEYSPKRRTALVVAGSGSSGAYQAGVLRALDESGIKIDVVIGSGVGAVTAAFAAVAGGSRLYGPEGFWKAARSSSFYRLRRGARVAGLLLVSAFAVFLLPVALAILAGLAFPLLLVVALLVPGLFGRAFAHLAGRETAILVAYLAALAAPVFALSILALGTAARLAWRDRRRLAEQLETLLDAGRARDRLLRGLWEVARGIALQGSPPAAEELGRKYVALLVENLGQPGFRELVVRTGDLETGRALPFVLLRDEHRAAFAAARAHGPRSRLEGIPDAVDLRGPEHGSLLFDAVMTGLLPPLVTQPRRVQFPRGGIHAGETHRLADAALAGGCGIAEALEAGAEQVIVVSASPQGASLPPRRRGARALVDAALATLERQAFERELAAVERVNRMIETLGHEAGDGSRAWQDPATGRELRSCALYVIRPSTRGLGPFELDSALDPASEVEQTLGDLVELGYRDAYRLFVEPVVGAAPEPRPAPAAEGPDRAVGL